jgi:hypothetical protein
MESGRICTTEFDARIETDARGEDEEESSSSWVGIRAFTRNYVIFNSIACLEGESGSCPTKGVDDAP